MRHVPVLIAGTGAMACLFAVRLARSGRPVTLLGSWREAVRAIQTKGILGDGAPVAVQAETDPLRCGKFRCALVLTKASRTAQAADLLANCVGPDGTVLTLQNGLGNVEILAERLGAHRVLGGSTAAGCTLVGPGHIRPGGPGEVVIGNHAAAEHFREIIRGADFSVRIHEHLDGLLWGKLVINAGINPVAALYGINNGELLRQPKARKQMRRASLEAAAVADALGLTLPFPDPVAAVEEVALRTRNNCSSMLADLQRRLPTEVDAISGAVVRTGLKLGVPTPVNKTLWEGILGLENRYDPIRAASS